MALLVHGGRVVDPSRRLDEEGLDLLLEEGRVARLGRGLAAPSARRLDARGLVVAPGFLDLHVHLREPGDPESETIESGLEAAVAGGFTAVACMANTAPVHDRPEVTERILARAGEVALARVWPIAAVTVALEGRELTDFARLRAAGAVGFSDDGRPVASALLLRRALERAAALDVPLVEHLEEPALSPGWVLHEGEAAARLGLPGMDPAGEEIALVRAAVLARRCGARLHAAHLSTRGAIERLREEKARGARVSGEVTPHHFTLTDRAFEERGANAKMNPPLRGEEDRRAVLAALADGTLDCIASDHAPHAEARKAGPLAQAANGVVGLETAVPLALDRLLHAGVVDLPRLVALLATNPARVLGVPGGTLAPGAPADVTLLDLDAPFEVVPERFRSRSRNTPFAGMKLRGAPAATIVAGRVVWSARPGEAEEAGG